MLPRRKRLTDFSRAAKAVGMTSRISHTSFDARDAYAQPVGRIASQRDDNPGQLPQAGLRW